MTKNRKFGLLRNADESFGFSGNQMEMSFNHRKISFIRSIASYVNAHEKHFPSKTFFFALRRRF